MKAEDIAKLPTPETDGKAWAIRRQTVAEVETAIDLARSLEQRLAAAISIIEYKQYRLLSTSERETLAAIKERK